MAANTTAVFTRGPIVGRVFVDTAETWVLNPVNAKVLVSAADKPNGVRVQNFSACGPGTTASDKITLWLDDGTGKYQWKSFLIVGATPSTTVKEAQADFSLPWVFVLPYGWRIHASCYGGADINVFAYGADFEKVD